MNRLVDDDNDDDDNDNRFGRMTGRNGKADEKSKLDTLEINSVAI